MARPRSVTVTALLALVHGFILTLVALVWFGIASILSPDRGETSPLIVMLAEARGGLLIVLAVGFVVFAVGAWRIRAWAWWVGFLASVLNILYLARTLLGGEPAVVVLLGLIIPLIIIWYLLAPMGRQVFVRESGPSRPLQ